MNCSSGKLSFFAVALLIAASGCERNSSQNPAEPVAQQEPRKADHGADQEVTIQTVPVADSIYMLVGRGGNIGVSVGDDGVLIIDDKFAPLADTIRTAIAELSKGELEYVLNTHFHGDHTGGNPVFGASATIVSHNNVRKRLAQEGMAAAGLPQITFDKNLTIHFNGETIRAMHLAPSGHTDGDSVIYFENANVLHTGDQMFNGMFPFIDLNNGGDVLGYEQVVREILGMTKPDTKIIPGHGPLASPDDLRGYHQMLIETMGVVQEQKKQGKTLDQVKKKGLDPKWASWGQGFIKTDRWIETLYKGLPGQ